MVALAYWFYSTIGLHPLFPLIRLLIEKGEPSQRFLDVKRLFVLSNFSSVGVLAAEQVAQIVPGSTVVSPRQQDRLTQKDDEQKATEKKKAARTDINKAEISSTS